MTERHVFQTILYVMRSQPDLAWILRAKRASECGAPQYDISSLPDRGIVMLAGKDMDQRLQFVSHVLEKKSNHLAICLGADAKRLLPEFWCKRTTLDSMLSMRGHAYGKQLPQICLIIDYNKATEKSLYNNLFFNAKHLNLLVIVVVPDGKLPLPYQSNVVVTVRLGGANGLTRVENYFEAQKTKTFYYISPYTITMERYRRDQETQIKIYKSRKNKPE